MTWLQRYRFGQYIRNSLWVQPLLAMAVAMVVVRILSRIDAAMGWTLSFNPDAARNVIGMLASATFTFIVYVASALLLAVQLASAQLTPRIIGIVFRDRVTRFSLTLFVATFIFLCGFLVRIQTAVPLITGYAAVLSCLANLIVFLWLIDHVGKALRPSGALRTVATRGHQVITEVYPRKLTGPGTKEPHQDHALQGEARHTILSVKNGVLLAFDIERLIALARHADCIIEMAPQVGDWVGAEQPLFRVYGGQATPPPEALYACVAFGQERTMEQDPSFAFRIIVDIASKGLSPAINDPTTAVLAIDQLHQLLHDVGNRHLDEGHRHDATGALRLIYRTPDWEDFVHLAVTEIRQFGRESIQIIRRLRAMLENLIQTVPAERVVLLRQELNLLQRLTPQLFPEPEDQALANASDLQGVGGRCETNSQQRGVEPAESQSVTVSRTETPA